MKTEEKKVKESKSLTIVFDVSLEEHPEKIPPDLTLHIFDRSGNHLSSEQAFTRGKPVSKLSVNVPADISSYRIFLGPALPREDNPFSALMYSNNPIHRKKNTPSMTLLRKQSFSEYTIHDKSNTITLAGAILKERWEKWFLRRCLVKGRFVKRYTLASGEQKLLGLTNACVCIHEVDALPYIIARLPRRELLRLRDDLLDRFEATQPEPIDPFPGVVEVEPSVGPFSPSVRKLAESSLARIDVKETMLLRFARSERDLRIALLTLSDYIKPFFCATYWLYKYLKKEYLTYTSTDAQGYFETYITLPFDGDEPDLYFQACQCIGGIPQMVYDPGVACHTHWNYRCGTAILLEVDDPAAIVSEEETLVIPPSGVTTWVMPFGVGDMRLHDIKDTGLVDHDVFLNSPFGGYLRFSQGYSSNIPTEDLYFYRWQYKKESDTQWQDFTLPVHRHYVHEEPGKLPTYPIVTLGPKVIDGKHLYRFKPASPNQCEDVIPGGNNQWPTEDWFHESYCSYLNTPQLPGNIENAHGRYQFKLEIYSKAGVLQNPLNAGFDFLFPKGVDTDETTLLSRLPKTTEVDDKGIFFTLHIDNRPTTAEIDPPQIGTTLANVNCGFLKYGPGDMVSLKFHALHDDNHAILTYSLWRGGNTISSATHQEISTNPLSLSPLPISFTGNGAGSFQKGIENSILRDTCGSAAFSQNLHVKAKATNGHRRLDEYDSHAVWAFALAPKKVK